MEMVGHEFLKQRPLAGRAPKREPRVLFYPLLLPPRLEALGSPGVHGTLGPPPAAPASLGLAPRTLIQPKPIRPELGKDSGWKSRAGG